MDRHLDAVEKTLETTGIERERRRAIVDDLETQILDMLRLAAGDDATKENVESVLGRLDPPQAYANISAPNVTPLSVSRPPNAVRRFSPDARAGAIFIGFGLILLLVLSRAVSMSTGVVMPIHRSSGAMLILVVATLAYVIASVAGTVLGWLAVHRIVASKGNIYGMGWAIIEALMYPVVCLWSLSCFFSYLIVIAYYDGPEIPNRGRALFFIIWVCMGSILSVILAWVFTSVLAKAKRRVQTPGENEKAASGIAS